MKFWTRIVSSAEMILRCVWISRYSALMLFLAVEAFRQEQAGDALRRAAESGLCDLPYWGFIAGAFLLATSLWYWSRVVLAKQSGGARVLAFIAKHLGT
jgi:hypothetical protein